MAGPPCTVHSRTTAAITFPDLRSSFQLALRNSWAEKDSGCASLHSSLIRFCTALPNPNQASGSHVGGRRLHGGVDTSLDPNLSMRQPGGGDFPDPVSGPGTHSASIASSRAPPPTAATTFATSVTGISGSSSP